MNNDLPSGEAVDGSSNDQRSSGLLDHPSYEELEKKLTEAEQKISEHWDRIVRMQAEADNLQRRAERDVSNAHKYALDRFVGELLPIIDSLELCINNNVSSDETGSAKAVIEGVQLTHKLFLSVLVKFGVQQVNPTKEPFNPEYHQAISMQQDDSVSPGSVISVLQKGYTLNQRLVRPALVVVAKIEE